MVKIIQSLFVVIIIAMAIANAIRILLKLSTAILHPEHRTCKIDGVTGGNVDVIAMRSVMHDVNDSDLELDRFEFGEFSDI